MPGLSTGWHGLRGFRPPTAGGRPSTGPSAPSWPSPAAPAAAPTMPSAPSAEVSVPPATPYSPYGGDPELSGNLGYLSEYGKGLMDPGSDYYQRLSQAMQRQIGGQAAAGQRAAALRGAWGGLGGGMGGEVMQTAADIGQAGLEAQGMAESGLALRGPQMGAGMLQATFGPGLGLQQLGEQSRQFGAGLGEQARQYGGSLALQQQQLAAQEAYQQAQLQQQQQMAQMDALMKQYAMMFGMF